MIVVETKDPVRYSNLTAEEKKARRTKTGNRFQSALRKADESGLLQAGKNLLLGQGGAGSGAGMGSNDMPPPPPPPPVEDKKMKPALKWGLIIGGLAVVGVIAYMVIKKKAK